MKHINSLEGLVKINSLKEFALNNKRFFEKCLNNLNLMKIWHQTSKKSGEMWWNWSHIPWFLGNFFSPHFNPNFSLGASFISLTYCHLYLFIYLFYFGMLVIDTTLEKETHTQWQVLSSHNFFPWNKKKLFSFIVWTNIL